MTNMFTVYREVRWILCQAEYTCQQKLHEQKLCNFPVHSQVFQGYESNQFEIPTKVVCCPTVAGRKKCGGRKRSNTGPWTDLSSIPFINITCYKKNKIFSVNELSNNIASVDYRWYGTLIPRVVAVGLKTSNTVDLAFSFHSQGHRLPSLWSCSTDLTTICPCISIVTVTQWPFWYAETPSDLPSPTQHWAKVCMELWIHECTMMHSLW